MHINFKGDATVHAINAIHSFRHLRRWKTEHCLFRQLCPSVTPTMTVAIRQANADFSVISLSSWLCRLMSKAVQMAQSIAPGDASWRNYFFMLGGWQGSVWKRCQLSHWAVKLLLPSPRRVFTHTHIHTGTRACARTQTHTPETSQTPQTASPQPQIHTQYNGLDSR